MPSPATANRRADRAALALSMLCAIGCTPEPSASTESPPPSVAAPAPAAPPLPIADAPPIDGVARTAPDAIDDGLHVVLLGTGTPVPSPRRSGPALAVIAAGRPYLVDFGPGVVRRAVEAQERGVVALDPTRLDFALATHLHSDHTAGLSDLLLTPAVVGRGRPLRLRGPTGLVAMADHIVAAYRTDLAVRRGERSEAQMAGYRVEARDIEAGLVHADGPLRIRAFDVPHGSFDAAFGYRFDDGRRRIVVSGDTGPSDAVVEACDGCDVLVHEVYCKAGFDRGGADFRKYHGSFHTSAPQLAALAVRARPKLLVLSHLLLFGCSERQLLDEVVAGYRGRVALGRDLDVF